MRCIREILNQYGEANHLEISWDEFDVRLKNEVPDLSQVQRTTTWGAN
jgi:hypothetical protein